MPDEGHVLRLARKHRLSVYDAAYLELAQRERLRPATLDRNLAKAARAEGIPLLDFRLIKGRGVRVPPSLEASPHKARNTVRHCADKQQR